MRTDGIFGVSRRKESIRNHDINDQPGVEYFGEMRESVWDCSRALKIVFSGEIYNSASLKNKLRQQHTFYDPEKPSDNELIVHLTEESYSKNREGGLTEAVKESMSLIDGIFAVVISDGKELVLFRDHAGIKPLYYSVNGSHKSVAFASEKKALWNQGFQRVERVRPGNILTINLDSLGITNFDGYALRPDGIPVEIKGYEECVGKYQEALYKAVRKRILESDDKLGILISGGVDSTLLSKLFYDIAVKELGKELIGYTVGFEGSSDLDVATKFVEHFGIRHRTEILTSEKVENYLSKVIRAVEDRDFVQIETSVIPYSAMELAAKDNIRTMIVGQGPDEMWGGYTWYRNFLKEKGHDGLHEQLWEDFLLGDIETFERENKVARTFGIGLRYPYLDNEVIKVAMSASPELKVSSPDDRMGKRVHRELASRVGVPEEFAYKGKEAAQIGSGVHEVLGRIAEKHGYTEEMVAKLKYSPEAVTSEKLGSSARYGYKYADDPSEWQLPANVCLYLDILAYENGLLDTEIRDRIDAFIKTIRRGV